MMRTRATGRSEGGQSLVEFALILPIFLVLLVGIAEFGRAWMTRNIMTGASREAVRIAAVQDNTGAAVARANAILASAGIPVGGSQGATVSLNDSGVPYGPYAITVTYNCPMTILGFLDHFGISATKGTILLTTSTSMRKEY